jgi:hypothetical protein
MMHTLNTASPYVLLRCTHTHIFTSQTIHSCICKFITSILLSVNSKPVHYVICTLLHHICKVYVLLQNISYVFFVINQVLHVLNNATRLTYFKLYNSMFYNRRFTMYILYINIFLFVFMIYYARYNEVLHCIII